MLAVTLSIHEKETNRKALTELLIHVGGELLSRDRQLRFALQCVCFSVRTPWRRSGSGSGRRRSGSKGAGRPPESALLKGLLHGASFLEPSSERVSIPVQASGIVTSRP